MTEGKVQLVQKDVNGNPCVSESLMLRRLSLMVLGGMTARELMHFQKYGHDSLR